MSFLIFHKAQVERGLAQLQAAPVPLGGSWPWCHIRAPLRLKWETGTSWSITCTVPIHLTHPSPGNTGPHFLKE